MEVKPEIIALTLPMNCVPAVDFGGILPREVRERYPDQLFMADCSTVEEAVFADEFGFDFIGTTIVGYTDQVGEIRFRKDDFEIIR